MSSRRVVVTGMGLVSPLGNTVDTTWEGLCNGRSGIGPLTEFDASELATRIAGEVRDYDVTEFIPPKDARRFDKFLHYGVGAAHEALTEAGLADDASDVDATRVGLALGAGIGGIASIEQNMLIYRDKGPRRVSPFYIPGSIVNMISGWLSIKYGFKGPNIAVVTACTTSTHNIGLAARMIQYGDADVMVAGGSEYGTTPTAMAGFGSAKAMSTRNDDPAGASRPWDADRDGFVLSNGAGILVLEELQHARSRGAEIIAELAGFGMSGDAYHMTAPPADGEGAARCMEVALNDARIGPETVDYINAHGTSTPLGDVAETEAVKTVFGDHAYRMAMSSTKSMTGHLLGAAGGSEAVFTVLSLRDGIIPPTINLDTPGKGCDLDYVPHFARETPLDVALSNSFGFGGTNGTLVFRRFSG
ncbi:MAG: beta-ketoacyl-ACP synthase II [Xanthomonadales bacterium]|nr:beta-ketoacyl-ACP synthase II [Gammaproteobacteria bacterium]MBT8052153.1 beta-ketoacyl-ACP synthase II [Gammaproteobacteria bacterium]MBT8056838.1 beta-ketoacyl-ACP synthase II [Gammaproteobacteria bacterium]NNJ79488.1 beta-ketoacyl-ACP synthase II [Xanthomonadales bacterium]NNL05626.1 beta-ketoacyl-ACP synthase II [Xanthomonadales bacterium]